VVVGIWPAEKWQRANGYTQATLGKQIALAREGGIGVIHRAMEPDRQVAEIDKVKSAGITAEEYQKALNMVRSRFFLGLQTIAGKAAQLGRAEILYGGYENLFTLMDRYASVQREQVQEAARKYLTDNNRTVGKLIPEGGVK
jgi:predicted Zn-dependent peptidase